MRQIVLNLLLRLTFRGGQKVVNFLLTDLYPLGNLTLTHLVEDQLTANILTHLIERQAVRFQVATKCCHGHLVTPGNTGDGLIDGPIINADARTGSQLDLNTFQNQLLQHLSLQHILCRQGDIPGHQLLLHGRQTVIQLTAHDDILVNLGHDTVQLNPVLRCRLCISACTTRQTQESQ